MSCKKHKDETLPVINILSPAEEIFISAVDTFNVKALISDNENLESISVVVLDIDQKQVSDIQSVNPSENPFNLDIDHIINDRYLESGQYYIQVSATDGVNLKKEFVKINLTSVQQEFQKAFFFCRTTTGQISVYKSDVTGGESLVMTIDEEYNDAAVNSYSRQFSLQYQNGLISSYDVDNFDLSWQVSDIHVSSIPFQGKLNIIDHYTYASTTNFRIVGYDHTGFVKKVASIENDGFFPSAFIKHEDYLMVCDKPGMPEERIEKLNFETGYYLTQSDVDMVSEEMYSYDEDHVIICGNKNNIAKICTLSVVNGLVWELDFFPDEKYQCGQKLSNTDYLFSIGTGLYVYNRLNNFLTELPVSINVQKMKFEALDKKLFLSDSNIVYVYSYPQFNLLGQIELPDKVMDIEFLYNK